MKQKKILVTTSFGLVPFEAIKGYIDPEIVKLVDSYKEKILGKTENTVPEEISHYVRNLAEKRGWRYEKMFNFLVNLGYTNLSALFSVILREVAIELDRKYEDHIEKSPEIYCVSSTNGHIFKLDKKHIKNFRNFAAFRTTDDAKQACRVTRGFLREMFKSGKSK